MPDISNHSEIISEIDFNEDYSVKDHRSGTLEPMLIGVLLSTVERLCQNIQSEICMQQFKGFHSLSDGMSYVSEHKGDCIEFKHRANVRDWADMAAQFAAAPSPCFPTLPTAGDILEYIQLTEEVELYASKKDASSNWSLGCNQAAVTAEGLSSIVRNLMQINLLLSGGQHPHGRFCFSFNGGDLLVWLGQESASCFALVRKSAPESVVPTIIHCGEIGVWK